MKPLGHQARSIPPRFRLCLLAWTFAIALSCSSPSTMAAQGNEATNAIKGLVRDELGRPLQGATVTLTATPTDHQTPAISRQTNSGPAGEYSFSQLPAGELTVSAGLSGYAPSSLVLPSSSNAATVDLTLTRTSSAAPSNSTPSSPGPLQFQASGIHGLIDPGGYSASASAEAAPGVLRGIADVRRSDGNLDASSAKDWPCDLEPRLRKAAAERPEREEALRSLGQFYVAHHQPARALPLLQRATELDANDYSASRNLGVAWLQSGQFADARRQFATLIAGHDKSELHSLLAKADEGLGMFRQAAEEYKKADIGNSSEENLFGVGYELILSGSPAEALSAFQSGLAKYPRSISLHIGTGAAQFLLSQFSQAVDSFLGAVDVDPADPRPYGFLSASSGLSGEERDRVVRAFQRFSDLKPDNAEANYFYALSLMRGPSAPTDHADNQTAKVESLLKKAIALDSTMARAHLQLADLYARHNDYQAALPEYESAIRLDQKMGEAHYRLAIAYKRAGRPEQSEREMLLFQQLKAGKPSGSVDADLDIAQFISVIETPTGHLATSAECNEAAH